MKKTTKKSDLKILRDYAMILILLWVICTFIALYHYEIIAHVIKSFFYPVIQEKGWSIINLDLTSSFSYLLSYSSFLGFLATLPFLFILSWKFIHPGLYPKEKQTVLYHLVGTLLLVSILQALTFLFITPKALSFFLSFHEQFFDKILDFQSIIGFIFTIQKGFFFCSLLPGLLSCLLQMRIISLSQVKKFRKTFYVLAFIIGMLLTPPDVISQCILALTLIALFEGTVYFLLY